MLPLIVAFSILALLYRWLLRRRSGNTQGAAKSNSESPKLPVAHQRLLDEAFEHSPAEADFASDLSPIYPILVLYATEYGFACQVARKIAQVLASIPAEMDRPKLVPRVVNVLHYKVIDFTRESIVAFVCSTTGDGVPPNEATNFRDALTTTDVVLPSTTRFAILALGDRAYPHFCRAGVIFDDLLPDACRLLPRVDVDQEDWDVIDEWIESLQSAIYDHFAKSPPTTVSSDYLRSAVDKYAVSLSSSDARFSFQNPFLAPITYRKLLTGPSTHQDHKQVVRVEFDISSSGMDYKSGDALAIIPKNNPAHVMRLLRTLATNGDELVHLADSHDRSVTFETALSTAFDLKTVRPQLIAFLARHSASAEEVSLARRVLGYDPRDPAAHSSNSSLPALTEFGKQYISEREINDVLMDFPSAPVTVQQISDHLRPLHARYYSISSSPLKDPNTVAITVDVIRYETGSAQREGVASTFLHDRCRIDDSKVGVFVSKNDNFRLPTNHSKPIIMIGPGTGIAPFIAFLEEREANGATGSNWLFFGCRFEKQDFLYADELLDFAGRGFLKLFTAFSRDGPEKVYVQDHIRSNGAKLWDLINQQEAHIYICGDGTKMAGDVDRALRETFSLHGNMTFEDATAYLQKLAEDKRYQRDVWVS